MAWGMRPEQPTLTQAEWYPFPNPNPNPASGGSHDTIGGEGKAAKLGNHVLVFHAATAITLMSPS